MSDDVTVVSPAPLSTVHDIRRTVFVDEQGVDPAAEFDDLDDVARHFLARVGGDPAGTARLRSLGERTARVERVAVLPAHRGVGIGRVLMDAAHDRARETGHERSVVHAQARVEAFYHALGYETVGPVASDTAIPHVEMRRSL